MNRHVVALLLGFLSGAAAFLCALVFNPFTAQSRRIATVILRQ